MNPLSCQILYHDSVSVIVSRFKSFTKNFVICCYQVTKTFCSRYGCASASCARGPCNLGFLANVAVSVLREVSEILWLPDTTFLSGSEAGLRKELAGASLCAGTLSSTRFSVNSSNHSGMSRPVPTRCPHVYLCFRFLLVLATGLPVLQVSTGVMCASAVVVSGSVVAVSGTAAVPLPQSPSVPKTQDNSHRVRVGAFDVYKSVDTVPISGRRLRTPGTTKRRTFCSHQRRSQGRRPHFQPTEHVLHCLCV